ncbi:hypothetical protein BC936DRAFT_140213 [Jimgerdemannia flammicorona]|uniref:Uncharacterized protein n=1 Tax=Jimgerdemannia flammicorona TaxID=994334 RepID=A0A433AWN6_9FUNG|nr:hypothetical protein BC936DRAFT_140213 [Jimgerdemannia flammicorona]
MFQKPWLPLSQRATNIQRSRIMSLNQPSSSDKPPPQPEDYVVAPGPGVDPVVYWLQHMWTAYKYACYFEKHPFYSEFFNLYVRTQLAMEVLRSHDSRAYALEWFRKTVAEVNRIRDRLTIIGDRNPELLDDYAERCLRASYALMVQRLQTVIIYYEYLEERYQQFQREGDKSETNQENTEEKKMTENNDFSPTAAGEPPPQQEKQATLTDKDKSKVGALNLDQTTATGTSSKKPATIGPQPGVTTDPKDNTMTQGNTQPAPGPGTVGQPLQQMTYPDGRPRPSYSWRNRVYGHPGSTTNTPQPSLDPEMTGQLSSQAIEDHNPAESRKRKQYSSQDNGDDDVGDHEAAATSSDGVSGVAKKGRTSGETIGGMNGTGSGPDQNVDNFQSGNVDVDVNSSIQVHWNFPAQSSLQRGSAGILSQTPEPSGFKPEMLRLGKFIFVSSVCLSLRLPDVYEFNPCIPARLNTTLKFWRYFEIKCSGSQRSSPQTGRLNLRRQLHNLIPM